MANSGVSQLVLELRGSIGGLGFGRTWRRVLVLCLMKVFRPVVVIAGSFAAAWLSWNGFERQFLRIKARIPAARTALAPGD